MLSSLVVILPALLAVAFGADVDLPEAADILLPDSVASSPYAPLYDEEF